MAAYTINNGDIFKAAFYCSTTTQESVSSFNVECEYLVPGAITDQALVDQLSTFFAGGWKSIMSGAASYRGVTARLIHPVVAPPPVTKFSTLLSGPGTRGTTVLPQQASGLVSWHTDYRGPHYRGRTYLPFPDVTDNDVNGVPTNTFRGVMGTFTSLLQAGCIVLSGGATLQAKFGVFLEGLVAFQPYVANTVHGDWATQIRRSNFRRKNTAPF